MCDLKICRACLRSQCKMYKYDQFQLKLHYEDLMALYMDDKQKLPQYFCFECAALLYKFRKFKEKCFIAQNKLVELQWESELSYENVEHLRCQTKCVKSPLDIMTISKRVKTYNIKKDLDEESYESDNNCIDDTDVNTEFIKEEPDKEIKSIAVEYVDEYTDNLEFDEDGGDNTSNFEPEIPEKTLNPEEELKISICNDSAKAINENVEYSSTDILKNLLVNPKNKYDKIPQMIPKNNKRHKKDSNRNPKQKPTSKNPYKRKKKIKKDVDFEPDNFSIYGVKERNPAFAKKKKRFLAPNHWKKSTLTEDEVLTDMKKKAEDPKYIAAQFKCTGCVKWFREEDILKRHRQLRHDEEIGTLECRFCHMRFKLDYQLRRHLRSHFTKYECLRCDLVCPLESTALLHDDYHNGVIKKCKHCGEEFKHASTYYTHLRTHRSEYLCTLCGMSFVSQLGLIMHKKIKHVSKEVETQGASEELDLYCEKCKIRFETETAYEEHIFQSALHIEEDLESIRNVVDDDDDKPLSKLNQRKAMIRKRKRALKIPHRKPTTCHQCGKHFSTQNDCLKHHLAEHRGTSFFPPSQKKICEICGLLLAPGSVAMHLNTHTREKLHSCETCGRQFNTLVSLKRHRVTHTGEKKFPCPLCEKRFTQNGSMKLHYRTYHLKEPYPKRNRRKKEILLEPPDPEESTSSDSYRDNNVRRAGYTRRTMQYLTLT